MAYRRGNAYYRSRRKGSRVVTEYLGSGEGGWLMQQLDEERQAEISAARAREQVARRQQRELDVAVRRAGDAAAALTRAVLLAAGFHQHKGQWRRRRDGHTTADS